MRRRRLRRPSQQFLAAESILVQVLFALRQNLQVLFALRQNLRELLVEPP